MTGVRTGISRVQPSNDFPKQRHCFVLRVNPGDTKSQSIYFSATCEESDDLWMIAFKMTTEGLGSQRVAGPIPAKLLPRLIQGCHCSSGLSSGIQQTQLYNDDAT